MDPAEWGRDLWALFTEWRHTQKRRKNETDCMTRSRLSRNAYRVTTAARGWRAIFRPFDILTMIHRLGAVCTGLICCTTRSTRKSTSARARIITPAAAATRRPKKQRECHRRSRKSKPCIWEKTNTENDVNAWLGTGTFFFPDRVSPMSW